MANLLPVLLILLIESCAISAMRVKECWSCPQEDKAWVVVQELTTLDNLFGIGQHSELLFCYLSGDQRRGLGLPAYGPDDHLIERTAWLDVTHLCYGVAYAKGIDIYEKRLGEPRMFGAPGKCADTQKYFKGCISVWRAPLVDSAARLPSNPDDGWWLLQMIHAFNTCQPTWTGANYNGFPLGPGGVAHNCNGFAHTLLACSLQRSTDLHLSSPGISNKGFEHTCACAENNNGTGSHKQLQIYRKVDIFQPCEGGWSRGMVFSSSSSSSSSTSQHASDPTLVQAGAPHGCSDHMIVSDHPSMRNIPFSEPVLGEPVLGATDPLIMNSVYQSGCYCDAGSLTNCHCKAACDKRRNCGVKVEQSRCTWCCEDGDKAYWRGVIRGDPWDLASDYSPVGQQDTCQALDLNPGKEDKSLYDVLSISRISITNSAKLCERPDGTPPLSG